MGIRLPRLISSGMVLQQHTESAVWGYADPGAMVEVSFRDQKYTGITDEKGKWRVILNDLCPGGPDCMRIELVEKKEEIRLTDILVGDVWLCEGQSNMELPMRRVKDRYPQEITDCHYDAVRTFKITEHTNFHGPEPELLSGEWKSAIPENILDFSATAYFFARETWLATGVPIGLLNTSLGGSRIESWMDREMLSDFPELLQLADTYSDDRFIEAQRHQNEVQAATWQEALNTADQGSRRGAAGEAIFEDSFFKQPFDTMEIPCMFRDTKLKDFMGVVWFRRKFTVPDELVGQPARLWLGTIVDSDITYLNGIEVGRTEYQYPPRKYEIQQGILHKENELLIRVISETGKGRFTPGGGKKYALFTENVQVDLRGTWEYRIGAGCEQVPETDFVNWKPTGLYHGMVAPCHEYAIRGVIWYQGEANTAAPASYLELNLALLRGYRQKWAQEHLPFYYVQLPNFTIDLEPEDVGWPCLREQQRRLELADPDSRMAVAIDLGEDNDLHPLNKAEVGRRLSLLVQAEEYGMSIASRGPEVIRCEKKALKLSGDRDAWKLVLTCAHAEGGLRLGAEKQREGSLDTKQEMCAGAAVCTEFEIAGTDMIFYRAQATLYREEIHLWSEEVKVPVQVRYCFCNAPKGALVYNQTGLPMSPFLLPLDQD